MNLIANEEYYTPDLMIHTARAPQTPNVAKTLFWQRAAAELRSLIHRPDAKSFTAASSPRDSAIARAAALEILG